MYTILYWIVNHMQTQSFSRLGTSKKCEIAFPSKFFLLYLQSTYIKRIKLLENNFYITYITPTKTFPKFYGKVGVISWLLFHLIWKNYILDWDFDSNSRIVDFFTRENTPQNNFFRQNISVENNYFFSPFEKKKY